MYLRDVYVLLLPLILLFGSCSTGPDSDAPKLPGGDWHSPTLENRKINVLKTNQQNIYVGTDQGMYVKSVGSGQSSWNSINLTEKQVIDFGILGNQEILVNAAIPSIESNQPSLFKTEDRGLNWQAYQNGFGGENYNWVSAIDIHPTNKDIIYARGMINVAKSMDRGRHWTSVYWAWDTIGRSMFVKIHPSKPNIIWAGGATLTFTSHLVKSTDRGETWTRVDPVEDNVETTCFDIAFTEDKNNILVGMGGAIELANLIRKSTDGGKNWETVLQGINTRTFTHSARNPEIVYASGRNTGSTLFFAASTNFGDTWEIVKMEDGPTGVQVNDMVSVMEGGREVLYFGTNKGLFSYTFEEE